MPTIAVRRKSQGPSAAVAAPLTFAGAEPTVAEAAVMLAEVVGVEATAVKTATVEVVAEGRAAAVAIGIDLLRNLVEHVGI